MSASPITSDIEDLIEARFASLSPRLQQAARYIIDNPRVVAVSTMRALAARADVDPSSMVRLAQELGFSGYEQVREYYRRKLLSEEGPWSRRARDLRSRNEDSRLAPLVREILEQDQINLERTFSAETIASLGEAKTLIEGARSVYVLGLRSLFPVAFYFHYACRLFNTKTVLLTGTGGTFADDLRLARAEDVILAFSYQPYARDAVRATEYVRGQGAKVIAVTDSKVSPVAKNADVSIIAWNSSTSLLPTVIPFLAIAQALATLLVSESSEDAIRQIARSEEQLFAFDVYSDDEKVLRSRAAARRSNHRPR